MEQETLEASDSGEQQAVPRVLVIGPAPGTAGGIGTMMGHVRATTSVRSVLTYMDPGSTGQRRLSAFIKSFAVVVGRRSTYDLAHINLSSNGSFYRKLILSMAVRLARRPYLVHLHGSEFREFYGQLSPVMRKLCDSMMRKANKVLVLGHAWHAFVTDEIGCGSNALVILPNAVPGPTELSDRPKVPGSILFTGRIGRRKGVPELLEAVRELPESENWSLSMAGDVTEADVQAMLDDAPANVASLGWLSQGQLSEVLSNSSIFVLPSHAEGLPLSLLDAMAWGLAPVVSDAGSIGDAVEHGKNALVVEAGNVGSIRAALLRLISDPELVEKLGSAARLKWQAEYSIAAYRARLDDLYEPFSKG